MVDRRPAVVVTLVLLSVLSARAYLCHGQPPETRSHIWSSRQVTLTVKVVFVGFDSAYLDMSYMEFNVPSQKFQLFLGPRANTNVEFRFKYEYVFTRSDFKKLLVDHLSSIAKVEHSWNPFFNREVENTFFAAQDVEDWLHEHSSSFGDLPLNGYTLVLMNFREDLPSVTFQQYEPHKELVKNALTPHYYNASFEDPDLGLLSEAKFMTSWGGRRRIYFIDTSAGPSHRTSHLPLQLAAAANRVDFRTAFGSRWLSQRLSDLISASVHNLFAPDFGYPLHFAHSYVVKVLVLDTQRSESTTSHEGILKVEMIKTRLESLLPFASLHVGARFGRLDEFAELSKAVVQSSSEGEDTSIVDLYSVYEWLHANGPIHMSPLLGTVRDENQYDIPVIVLIFKNGTIFTAGSPEWLELRKPNGLEGVCGMAAYDMAVLGVDSKQFSCGASTQPKQSGKGYGLTRMVAQAAAIMIGLIPPSHYDPTQDFVSSVMAWYPKALSFSQFEMDAVLRGHTDILLMQAQAMLSTARWTFTNAENIAKARGAIRMAEAEYVQMKYSEAVKHAFDAASHASRVQGSFTTSPTIQELLPVAAAGIALGAAGAYFLARHRLLKPHARCPYCGRKLRWGPESRQWLCSRCGAIERKLQ